MSTTAKTLTLDDGALDLDMSSPFTAVESPMSPPPLTPILDLDTDVLPPLDDLTAVEEALGFSALHFDLPAPLEHVSPPSDSSVSSRSMASPEREVPNTPKCCPDVHAALTEISTRLNASNTENAALRTRVAELVRENRTLRNNLDMANKQAQANPLLLGLAKVSAEAAGALASALHTVPKPPPGKKRKRATMGKTLACVVLMAGFFFGSPSVMNDTERTEGNLPAIWSGESKNGLVRSTHGSTNDGNGISTPPVRPSLCLRTLEQLPPPELASKSDDEIKSETWKSAKIKHEAVQMNAMSVGSAVEPAVKKRRTDQFSYVLCRDAPDAVQQVSACSKKMQKGYPCGSPHEISLIMPAAALRGEDSLHEEVEDDDYAEVKCNIMSVKRISAGQARNVVSGATAANLAMEAMTMESQKPVAVRPRMGAGRVLASVREEVVGT